MSLSLPAPEQIFLSHVCSVDRMHLFLALFVQIFWQVVVDLAPRL